MNNTIEIASESYRQSHHSDATDKLNAKPKDPKKAILFQKQLNKIKQKLVSQIPQSHQKLAPKPTSFKQELSQSHSSSGVKKNANEDTHLEELVSQYLSQPLEERIDFVKWLERNANININEGNFLSIDDTLQSIMVDFLKANANLQQFGAKQFGASNPVLQVKSTQSNQSTPLSLDGLVDLSDVSLTDSGALNQDLAVNQQQDESKQPVGDSIESTQTTNEQQSSDFKDTNANSDNLPDSETIQAKVMDLEVELEGNASESVDFESTLTSLDSSSTNATNKESSVLLTTNSVTLSANGLTTSSLQGTVGVKKTYPVHHSVVKVLETSYVKEESLIAIQINPADLGKINLHLSFNNHNKSLQAFIQVENPQIIDFLNDNKRLLEKIVSDYGYQFSEFNFDANFQKGKNNSEQQDSQEFIEPVYDYVSEKERIRVQNTLKPLTNSLSQIDIRI